MSYNKGSQQELFEVVLRLESGKTKTVKAKAASRKVAERRAMKRTESAVAVVRN